MAETNQSSHSFNVEPKTLEGVVPIPVYDPGDQYSVADLEVLWPDWRTGEEWEDLDPVVREEEVDKELLLMSVVDTFERRRIAEVVGISSQFINGEGLERAIDQIPSEVGLKFDAHGIAGKRDSPINDLDRLLKKGIDPERPFYSMSLLHCSEAQGAIGAERPFTEGGLIVVSGKDEKLISDGIKSVIVGENYVKCTDLMRSRYPNLNFVPWNEAASYFIGIVNSEEGAEYAPNVIDNPETFHDLSESDPLAALSVAPTGSVALKQVII